MATMTGRIKSFDQRTSCGCIESDHGHEIHFDSSVVVAYDVGWLAVGQAVTFQLANSTGARASYVSVETPRASSGEPKKEQPLFLRYLGFDQQKSLRAYRFERVMPGDDNVMFTVTTDLALFAKYHVGIQEGPNLCRTLLVNGIAVGKHQNLQLAEPDMEAFLAARVIPVKKTYKKRPAPGAVATEAAAAAATAGTF
jgi:cold shock CspA family protein